jgi:DNA-binding transcriptional regulator YiaG
MNQIATSKQFKGARQKLGLSVAECAELCNVDARTIRRWETGAGHGDGRDPHPSACRLMEVALQNGVPAK